MGSPDARMREIVPDKNDSRAFRDALGRYATGVTVVTVGTGIGPLGITANSFAGVSLDPPLVLWSLAKASLRYTHFRDADRFAVHVLGENQRDLCVRFSRSGHDFDGADWRADESGLPLLGGCLARFVCRRSAVHDGGDHGIIVGEVACAKWRDGAPLIFSQGAYGRFADPAPVLETTETGPA